MGDSIVVRKSSRLTERVARTESDNHMLQKDYDINLVKTLKKKAEQCSRDIKVLEEQKGQNRVFQMSGGIYELYRHALVAYYETLQRDSNCQVVVQIKPVKDKKGVIVETQIKVNYSKNGKNTGPPMYTVNLYHTRSSMMVNGREAHKFTGDHRAAIAKVLNVQNMDTIDQEFRGVILKELDKIQIVTNSTPQLNGTLTPPALHTKTSRLASNPTKKQSQNTVVASPGRSTPLHTSMVLSRYPSSHTIDNLGQIPSSTDNHHCVCPHCNVSPMENAIECSTCCNWFHYTCERMGKDEFERHCDDLNASYTCLSCMSGAIGLNDSTETTVEDLESQNDINAVDRNANGGGSCDADEDDRSQQVLPTIMTNDGIGELHTLQSGPIDPDEGAMSRLSVERTASPQQGASLPTEQIVPLVGKAKKMDKPRPTSKNIDGSAQVTPILTDGATGRVNCSIDEQMLKSKEKTLNQKEKKLKDAEKKLHLKEMSLADQIDQNEYSKAYILTMENKLKELENSNRLLKMKMLSQYGLDGTVGEQHLQHNKDSVTAESQAHNIHSDSDLKSRVTHLEFKVLENRITQLEHNLASTYGPHGAPHNYNYYYYPHHPCHSPATPYYTSRPQYTNSIPSVWDSHYHPYHGSPEINYWHAEPHVTYQYSQSQQTDSTYMNTHQQVLSNAATEPIHLVNSSDSNSHTNQNTQYPTSSIDADSIQPIPVHFSCRGRRKTTRLKPSSPPSLQSHQRIRRRRHSPPVDQDKDTPVDRMANRLAHTGRKGAAVRGNKTTAQNVWLETDNRPPSYPSILLLEGECPQRKGPQLVNKSPLEIPKILVLEPLEDAQKEVPNHRCQ